MKVPISGEFLVVPLGIVLAKGANFMSKAVGSRLGEVCQELLLLDKVESNMILCFYN